MDSETTLFTFLYECPSVVRTVELFGSWDNFSKPYHMERDARRSNRHWAGCYRFDDIVYDGTEEGLTAKRSGGLKMGGSYWFYYRINGDMEAVDQFKPRTTACPLLPGQQVNILDVPIETPPMEARLDTGLPSPPESPPLTLNPGDRYLHPRPAPSPTSLKMQQLPRLATSSAGTIIRRPSASANNSPISPHPHQLTRPLSATDDSATMLSISRQPRSKSATSTPSSAIKTAFMHLKGSRPTSADEQSRGRSRSQREPKEMEIGHPVLVSRTDSPRHCIPIAPELPESPMSATQECSSPQDLTPPFSPLRCHPVNLANDSSSQNTPELAKESSSSVGFRTRTPSPLRRWAAHATSETVTRSRSVSSSGRSRSRGREPSPLRNELTTDDGSSYGIHVPEDIQEVEDETEGVSFDNAAWPLPNNISGNQSSLCHSPMPDVHKELPELPPSVQLADRGFSRLEVGFGGTNEPGSHFSVWTYDTAESEEFVESPTSPTFSSTATSSSFNTPARWSSQSEVDDIDSEEHLQSIVADPKAGGSTITLTAPYPCTRQLSSTSATRRQGIFFDTGDTFNTYGLPVDGTPGLTTSDEQELRNAVAELHQAVNGDKRDPADQIIDDFAYVGGLL